MTRLFRWSLMLALAVGSTAALGQAPAQVTAPSSQPGVIGALAPNATAQGTLTAVADGVAYHTYYMDVPAGATRVSITLDADIDLDLAVKYGSEIQSYRAKAEGGDWDYRDIETVNPTVLTIDQPQVGRWYIDVINAFQGGTQGTYRLSVATTTAAASPGTTTPGTLPGKVGAGAPPSTSTAPTPTVVTASSSSSMSVGALPIEGIAKGSLMSASGGRAYHTYWVDVPAGVARWTLTLTADVDLDIAVKYGAEIQNYSDKPNGDWNYRDISSDEPTTMVIEAPQSGRWYIDVFTLLEPGIGGAYQLTTTAGGQAAVGVPVVTPPPGATYGGTFRMVGGDLELVLMQGADGSLIGTLRSDVAAATVDGRVDVDRAYGMVYCVEVDLYLEALLTNSGMEFVVYDLDDAGVPVAASERYRLFERVGSNP